MTRGPLLLLASALVLTACDEPCVADLDLSCTPLEADTSWSNVYEVVIQPSCAPAGVSCHASEGLAGGLDLGDESGAYEALGPHLTPGDAACSDTVKRLYSDRSGFQMPPGSALSEPEACMIVLWIDAGAQP